MASGLLSREELFERLKVMDPAVLASLIVHGGGIPGAATTSTNAVSDLGKPFNLGKTVSDWKDGPIFMGNLQENLGRWLENIQEGFRLWAVPDEYKVPFAVAFLRNTAKQWFKGLDKEQRREEVRRRVDANEDIPDDVDSIPGFVRWADLKTAIVERFMRTELAHEVLADLFALKMTNGLAEYYQEFEEILSRIPSSMLNEDIKMAAFKANLKSETAESLRANDPPKTYLDLVAHCEQLDAAFAKSPQERKATTVAAVGGGKSSEGKKKKKKAKAKSESKEEKKEDEQEKILQEEEFLATTSDIPFSSDAAPQPLEEENHAALVIQRMYKQHRRQQKSRNGELNQSRNYHFSTCLGRSKSLSFPSLRYRLMFLGTLPHLLVCIEAVNTYALQAKAKEKRLLHTGDNHVLVESGKGLTHAVQLLKEAKRLQQILQPMSSTHMEGKYEIFEKYTMEVQELVSQLPSGNVGAIQGDLGIALKAIQPPKPKRALKPELNWWEDGER